MLNDKSLIYQITLTLYLICLLKYKKWYFKMFSFLTIILHLYILTTGMNTS